MNLGEYKFEVMLIVIVSVLLIFWLMLNYFDKKPKSNEFAPINSNEVNANNKNAYTVETFTSNNTPTIPVPETKNEQLKEAAEALQELTTTGTTNKTSNNSTTDTTNTTNDSKNELEQDLSVAVKNSTLTSTNESVPSFYSLSIDQLSSLKRQTRGYGVLGLVFYDNRSDTLRIESTKTN